MLRGAALLPLPARFAAHRSSQRLLATRAPRPRAAMASEADPKDRVGFKRAEMFSEPLYGTVKPFSQHIFVAHGAGTQWAGKLETVDGPLKDLTDAAEARADDLKAAVGKVKITAYEASPEAGDMEGDVLLYPQMLRLRPAPAADALIATLCAAASGGGGAAAAALPGAAPLEGPAVFVCAHARRDKRCGVCGPALIDAFKAALRDRPALSAAPVRGCSHIGGHAYAGNVVVFSKGKEGGTLRGDWFGYVSPSDVAGIVDGHIANGEDPSPRLWRGRMGMSVEAHTDLCKVRLEALEGSAAGGGGCGAGGGGGGCEGCDDNDGRKKGPCGPAGERGAAPAVVAGGVGGILGWFKGAVGYGRGGAGGSEGQT